MTPRDDDEPDRRHVHFPHDDDVQPGDPRNEPTKFGELQDDGLDLWPDDGDRTDDGR